MGHGIAAISARASEIYPSLAGRDRLIFERLAAGFNCAEIGRELGLSRQRVQQLIERIATQSGVAIPPWMEGAGLEMVKQDRPASILRLMGEWRCACGGSPHYACGLCSPCWHRRRYRDSPKYREQLKRLNLANKKRWTDMAEKDEERLGLTFDFGKKPLPKDRALLRSSKYSPIYEKAVNLEADEWFSVGLPTQAIAQAARAALIPKLRSRWPKSDPDSRAYLTTIEGSTLWVKRLR